MAGGSLTPSGCTPTSLSSDWTKPRSGRRHRPAPPASSPGWSTCGPGSAAPPGCSMLWKAVPALSWPTVRPNAVTTGAPECMSRRSTRSAATRLRCAVGCPRPPWCSTRFTRCASQDAINTVRRRVQQDTLGHRGHKGDPLYGIRRVLLRGAENLTAKAYRRLLAGLDAGNPDGHVAAAYLACQELRHVYAAPDLNRARRRLDRFYWACALPGVAEPARPGGTISAWEAPLLAYFTTAGTSNGPTEAINLLIKRIKQVGFGFRTFANYRLRLRRHLAHSPHNPDPKPVTTLHHVEPEKEHSGRSYQWIGQKVHASKSLSHLVSFL